MKPILTIIGIAASISLVSLRLEGKETPVKLESLPEPLQKAITAAVGEGKIQSIASEVEDKQTSYEVAVVTGDQKLEHKFSSEGKLLETEEAVTLAALPESVRARFEKLAGTHKILEIVNVTADGKKFYEADIDNEKSIQEVKVSISGELIGTTMEPKEDADGDEDGDEDEDSKK